LLVRYWIKIAPNSISAVAPPRPDWELGAHDASTTLIGGRKGYHQSPFSFPMSSARRSHTNKKAMEHRLLPERCTIPSTMQIIIWALLGMGPLTHCPSADLAKKMVRLTK